MSAPSGVTLDPSTGLFTWIPAEAQGPSTNVITVRVTDNGSPPLSDTKSFVVVVNEVNAAPVFAEVPNPSVNEGERLTIAATAVDPDIPANILTYALAPGAPEGVSLDPATGAITWTPTEAQGPGSYPVAVTVTDNGAPNLNASKTVTVTVNEVNTVPILAAIGTKTIDEGATLEFTVAGSDSNNQPANTVSLGVGGLPTGATFNPASGAFAWTPGEDQQGTHNVIFTVTDDGKPPLSASETVTITVREVNVAPVLAALADKTVESGRELAFNITATDADLPANSLSYTLEPGAPQGAAIDPVSGAFKWTPAAAQAGTTNQIAIRVTDNGVPPLSDTKSFAVVVAAQAGAPVQLNASLLSNGDVRLVWTTTPGRTYVLQRSADLADWQDLIMLNAVGDSLEHIDATAPAATMRFYRVVQR